MRVIKADTPRTGRFRLPALADSRAARFERFGLAAASLVVVFGLALTSATGAATGLPLAAAVYFASFWLTHLVRWRWRTIGDPVLLPIVHLLSGLGLMAMVAIGDAAGTTLRAERMAWAIAAGTAAWAAIAFVDFEQPRLRRAILLPLGAAVLLAIALLVFGSGPGTSSAKVNLLGMQPIEIIRPLVVFSLAAYFARRWKFLRELSDSGWPRWKDVRPLLVSLAALLALFFLQRDLGPALVLSCVFFGLFGMSRARAPLVVAAFAVLIAGFTVGYFLNVPPMVARRVSIALDPWDNGVRGGDQIAHGLWAMSSGGVWGLGPGVGDPQLVPAGHTDLVITAVGEELGVIGVMAVVILFGLLAWRMLRIALRAPGDYTAFLAAGLALALIVQAAIIFAGVLSLIPLAGVVTPFLSYGRSAMISNLVAVAVIAAIGRRAGPPREPFLRPIRGIGFTLAAIAAIIAVRVGDVHIVRADRVATRPTMTLQADGVRRAQYNPRLAAAARTLVRGTIFDRNGLPLASSQPDELAQAADRFRRAGIALPADCRAADTRCYPLGTAAFHLLGESTRATNWAATNTSYVEHDFDAHLRGYRDLADLLPLVRHKGDPGDSAVQELRARDRSLHTTIDARLQLRVAQLVRMYAERAGSGRGAAIVIDPASGQLLASASFPEPSAGDLSGTTPIPEARLLDRARYGLYPPGSTFKLVTAVAALRTAPGEQHSTTRCTRLADGRIGGTLPGSSRPIRDDTLDRTPHGRVDLHRGLVVSCNLYFAHLAQRIGASALAETASEAQIVPAPPPVVDNLRGKLPHAGYGQADVLASPLRMARVAGALATDGMLRAVHVRKDGADRAHDPARWIGGDGAARLRGYMREAVTAGTGRMLARHAVPIAGKTGTAEVDDQKSHSWFVGYAPHGGRRKIAFAVVIENAGYGGQFAAPVSGEIVSAAQSLGLLQ